MRTWSIIIFLCIVIGIYSLVNFYILRRGWQALAGKGTARSLFLAVSLILVLSYPLGRFMERAIRNSLSEAVVILGSLYLALMLYLFLLVLLADVLRLSDKLFRFFPDAIRNNPQRAGRTVFLVVLGLALLTVAYGYWNAGHLRLRNIDLKISKEGGQFNRLNIVLASDIHFGTVVGIGRLEKIVQGLNNLEPDIVLLAGGHPGRGYLGPKGRGIGGYTGENKSPSRDLCRCGKP